MTIIYNLTDEAPLGKRKSPQVIKIQGKFIQPGDKLELDRVDLASLSGMIYGSKISVDERPVWYQKFKRYKRRSVPEGATVAASRNRREESSEEPPKEPAPLADTVVEGLAKESTEEAFKSVESLTNPTTKSSKKKKKK